MRSYTSTGRSTGGHENDARPKPVPKVSGLGLGQIFVKEAEQGYCRTRSIAVPFDNITNRYWEAICPKGSTLWTINEVTYSEEDPSVSKTKKINSIHSLDAVLKYLRDMEFQAHENKRVYTLHQNIDDLSGTHFTDYGIRNGFAFSHPDFHVHSTERGVILGDGDFTDDMRTKVRAAHENRISAPLKNFFSELFTSERDFGEALDAALDANDLASLALDAFQHYVLASLWTTYITQAQLAQPTSMSEEHYNLLADHHRLSPVQGFVSAFNQVTIDLTMAEKIKKRALELFKKDADILLSKLPKDSKELEPLKDLFEQAASLPDILISIGAISSEYTKSKTHQQMADGFRSATKNNVNKVIQELRRRNISTSKEDIIATAIEHFDARKTSTLNTNAPFREPKYLCHLKAPVRHQRSYMVFNSPQILEQLTTPLEALGSLYQELAARAQDKENNMLRTIKGSEHRMKPKGLKK